MRRSQKKVKCISNVTERMKRNVQQKWSTQTAEYRMRVKLTQASTPSSSDEQGEVGRTNHIKATLAYNGTKAYRRIYHS